MEAITALKGLGVLGSVAPEVRKLCIELVQAKNEMDAKKMDFTMKKLEATLNFNQGILDKVIQFAEKNNDFFLEEARKTGKLFEDQIRTRERIITESSQLNDKEKIDAMLKNSEMAFQGKDTDGDRALKNSSKALTVMGAVAMGAMTLLGIGSSFSSKGKKRK